MTFMRRVLALGSLVLIGLFIAEVPLHAYLDPGSTNLLLQGIVGAIAAMLVIAKRYWHRIIGVFRRSGNTHDAALG